MSNLKPTKSQLEFMDMELGAFFHFGIRTFNESSRDWDMIPMDLSTFNPTELNCEVWADDIISAGAKYAILTTKHHDGFTLWPSEYTEFNVKNTPWKNGKGDVIKEYTDAMRKKGVKVGLYYSCSQFDAKDQGEKYNNFVIGQITELLSNYGKIDILWFDGCGSEGDKYDVDEIQKTIFSLQPEIKVFGSWGNTCRWIGNEWGLAPMVNDNIITVNGEKMFSPGECDCCMIRNGTENFWFYTEGYKQCIRTKEEILGMYYYSIGRGANLLFNLAPDRRGLLQENQIALLKFMTDEMNRRKNDCKVEYKSLEKIDNRYRITLDGEYLIDHVFLEEDITDGQKIEEFTIYVKDMYIGVFKGYKVGHKAVCTFPPVRTGFVDIVIDKADEGEKLKDISISYAAGEQIFQRRENK